MVVPTTGRDVNAMAAYAHRLFPAAFMDHLTTSLYRYHVEVSKPFEVAVIGCCNQGS